MLFLSHLWGPLLLAAVSYFLIHFSQSGDSPPGSFDPSPWISSNRTDGDPMADLINWIASVWDLLSKETPLTVSRISPFCRCGRRREGMDWFKAIGFRWAENVAAGPEQTFVHSLIAGSVEFVTKYCIIPNEWSGGPHTNAVSECRGGGGGGD